MLVDVHTMGVRTDTERIDNLIVDKCKLVCHMTHINLCNWVEKFGTTPEIMFMEWACIGGTVLGHNNPYLSSKNILFTGTLTGRDYDIFSYIVDNSDFNVCVFGLFLKEKISDEIKQKFLKCPKINLMPSKKYGNFWEFYEHADLALNFSYPNQTQLNSKIYDYALYGIPIVSERDNPSKQLLLRNKGREVIFNNPQEFLKAFNDLYLENIDRMEIRNFMLKYHLWDKRALSLYNKILELL